MGPAASVGQETHVWEDELEDGPAGMSSGDSESSHCQGDPSKGFLLVQRGP